MENKKTLTLKEYNKQINKYNNSISKGLKPIIKKNWFKFGLGCLCLGIALFPNGLGIIFYPLGFFLLGFSLKDIDEIKRKIKNKFRHYKKRV